MFLRPPHPDRTPARGGYALETHVAYSVWRFDVWPAADAELALVIFSVTTVTLFGRVQVDIRSTWQAPYVLAASAALTEEQFRDLWLHYARFGDRKAVA